MSVKVLLLLFGFIVVTKGNSESQELDAIFNDLEKQLNYKQEFKTLIEDVKKEVTKSPDITTRTLGMAKALNLALPKLQGGRPADIAQGVLNVISGIAENLPFGQFIAPLASLVSSIIGLLSGPEVDNSLQTFIQNVVVHESDNQLRDKAEGAKNQLSTAFSYVVSKHSQTLDQAGITRLVGQVPVTMAGDILGMLKSRISYRSTTTNKDAANQCYKFCVLYAQIASMRDMIFDDIILQLQKAGDQIEAKGYSDAKAGFVSNYRQTLKFLHQPRLEYTATMFHHYPPGHNAQSTLLVGFMKMAGIQAPLEWQSSSKYVLVPVEWPSIYITKGGYWFNFENILLHSGFPRVKDQFEIVKRSDGYHQLKYNSVWLRVDPSNPTYLMSSANEPGDDQYGHFIVMAYPNTPKILVIGSRKFRGRFMKGTNGTWKVRLTDGFAGKASQFYAKKCQASCTSSYCNCNSLT